MEEDVERHHRHPHAEQDADEHGEHQGQLLASLGEIDDGVGESHGQTGVEDGADDEARGGRRHGDRDHHPGRVLECAEKARRCESRVPSDPAQDEYRRDPGDGGEDGAVPDHQGPDQDDQWYQQVAAPLQRFQHGRLAFPDLGEEPV